MLATPAALSEVLFGDHGVTAGIRPGTRLIEMSTIGPDHVLEVAARLPEGVEFVDAPGAGRRGQRHRRHPADLRRRQPDVVRALPGPAGGDGHADPSGADGGGGGDEAGGQRHPGGPDGPGRGGAGAGRRVGLDQQRVIPALLDSPIGPALSRKLDKIQRDRYAPSFKLSLMRKDLDLVLDAAPRRRVELKLVQDAAGWIERAEQQGLGGRQLSSSPRSRDSREIRTTETHIVASRVGATGAASGPHGGAAAPPPPLRRYRDGQGGSHAQGARSQAATRRPPGDR